MWSCLPKCVHFCARVTEARPRRALKKKRSGRGAIANRVGWGAERYKRPSSHRAVAIRLPPLHKHPSPQPCLSAGPSGEPARFVATMSERSLKNVSTGPDRRSVGRLVVRAHFEHVMLTLQRPHCQTQQHCRGRKPQMMPVVFDMLKEPGASEETERWALDGTDLPQIFHRLGP